MHVNKATTSHYRSSGHYSVMRAPSPLSLWFYSCLILGAWALIVTGQPSAEGHPLASSCIQEAQRYVNERRLAVTNPFLSL